MPIRWSLLAFAALALAAQAQTVPAPDDAPAGRLVPSRPSVPSTPMTAGAPLPAQPAPVAGVDRPRTQLLGGGSFGSAELEGALNTGTPPAWNRKGGPLKVCPPGLENRDNVCAAPAGRILSN